MRKFSGILLGRDDLRAIFQPLRSWLISSAPSEQKKAAARIVSRWTHKLALVIVFRHFMPDISFACPKCNQLIDAPTELANQLTECPTCKETIEVPIRSRTQSPDSTSSTGDESIFFQSGDIMVTNARFVVGAKTFAMRSITSVQSVKRKEEPLGITGMGCLSLIIIMLGFVMTCYGFGSSLVLLGIFGILIIAGGVWLVIRALPHQPKSKTIFTVVLTTAGGEVTAYESNDQNHISKIVQALNNSIISHG